MSARLTQDLKAGETWNLSMSNCDPMVIAAVKHNKTRGTVVLEGTREKDGKTYWVTLASDMEIA